MKDEMETLNGTHLVTSANDVNLKETENDIKT